MKAAKIILLIAISAVNCTYTKPLEFPKIKTLSQIPSNPNLRLSSYPYLSGDTFRSFCDFIIDKTYRLIDPDTIKDGDTIFVTNCTKFLDFFFKHVHPKIKSTYILITHNGDLSDQQPYLKNLEDDKIIAWFGQNLTLEHKKAFPIPIGLANRYWKYGNINIISKAIKSVPSTKKILLHTGGLATHTNPEKRLPVVNMFQNKSFCYNPSGKPFQKYLFDLANSKFVLSPEGNGIDCHRTWEALLMGAFPIVKTSYLDVLYEEKDLVDRCA